MTIITRQYSAAASQARSAVDKTADLTVQSARTLTGWLPGLPQVDLIPAVERYFDLVQRAVDINRHLAVRWAEAAGTLSGVVREQADSAGDIMREKAAAAERTARQQAAAAERTVREQTAAAERTAWEQVEKAEKAEKAAHDRAEKAERAEQERAREARKAERDQAAQVHDKARERYQGLAKTELTDLLAERQLPKSGNVYELVERLVEADGKQEADSK
jgi:flagellar biosynthesis GTPase FlhF